MKKLELRISLFAGMRWQSYYGVQAKEANFKILASLGTLQLVQTLKADGWTDHHVVTGQCSGSVNRSIYSYTVTSSLERPTLASRVALVLRDHFPTNECEISDFCL